jgi:hypothetical protein
VNYIHSLIAERDDALASKRDALELLIDLQAYLQSSKFYDDTTVQCVDVLRRLAYIKSALL